MSSPSRYCSVSRVVSVVLERARKKMSSKASTLCVAAALLLFYTITYTTARPEPIFSDIPPLKTRHRDAELGKVMAEEICEGAGEEECLERRTLAAHIDYIYTQKHKP